MGVLALMVGVAAIAVNRYLVRSHSELIHASVPAMELSSRIGASAEVVGTLATALAQADTRDDLDDISEALGQAVSNIEKGARELESMDPTRLPISDTSRTGEIVIRMTENRHTELRLTHRVAEELVLVTRVGEQLNSLIEAETDLARLRITASITGIYSGLDTSPLPELDRLADQHFFAFERLAELTRLVDAIRMQLQLVPRTTERAGLEFIRSDILDQLILANRRLIYLPTASTRGKAQTLLLLYRETIGDSSLIGLQAAKMEAQASISEDSEQLHRIISGLSEQARQVRDTVQADVLAQIARAERRSSLLAAVLLVTVLTAVITGSVLWLYARRQLVARLGNLSRRILAVAGGDFGLPMPISGQDELGRMEKALNILRRRAIDAARLRGHLEEAVILRTGEVVAEMRVSDAARAEAENANRDKTEFLARMSHEIRTPLNGLIGMLDLLEAKEAEEGRQERVRIALRSARELLEITNDILNYADSEDRSDRGNPVHFRLRELVGQLGQQLQSLALKKNLEPVVDLADPAPQVLCGDVVKIRQVVSNLISNAVKYTKQGMVTLSVGHVIDKNTGKTVLSFTVADTGTGMTRDAVAHAFDAYMRTDAVKRAGIEGLGLGLAISRNLTETMGGALSVESELGVGSRFTLTVPLALGDVAQLAQDSAQILQPGAEHKVLVIDDHAVNRMVARGYLERLGCKVSEAENGTTGLEACHIGRFDFIFIDLDLPDMTGEEVAAEIGTGPGVPVLIALTAHLISDTETNRARLGVARILSKPVSPRELAEVLENPVQPDPAPDAKGVLESLHADISDFGLETTGMIVREFLKDFPGSLETMLTAPAGQQRKAAHRLKGAASNFRLEEFCEILAQVEKQEAGAGEVLLHHVRKTAEKAVATLETAAIDAGIQTAAGSTK